MPYDFDHITRAALVDAIENAIDALDAFDGDSDLEETGDDEPTNSCHNDLEADMAEMGICDWPEQMDQTSIGATIGAS